MSQAISIISNSRKSLLLGTSALICLALAAPAMADDFVISSGTTTNDGNAIDGNDTVTLTGALIVPIGKGINASGGTNEVSVTASGSITTTSTSDYAFGIDNSGGGSTTTMLGSINTLGRAARGISSGGGGGNNTTIMSGNITTTGNDAIAIYADGGSNTTTMSGSISTTGYLSIGIFYTTGGSNSTTMSGSITTTGYRSYGIYASGGSNSTTMSGSITTTGDDALAIYADGGSNTTTMSGSITTTGDRSYGIYASGGSNSTTMSGSITTTGDQSIGILIVDDNNTTTMSGSITTTGDISNGIRIVGDNNTTTMTGSISSASDTYARGIYIAGNNNTTIMSGSISAAGTDAYAIRHLGDDNTTTISGSVTSTGTASSALMNTHGSGGTFILDEGAVIIGDITALAEANISYAAATNNILKFNLGESVSYALTIGGGGAGTGAGQWTFTDQDGRTPIATTSGTNCASKGVTVCNLVTGVSTGNLEVQDELQFSMNTSMIGSLSLGSSNSAPPVEAMSFAQTPQNNIWANIYGDTSDRSASATKLAFDGSNRGLTIGTPVAIGDTLNLDLVFNTSNANLDIGSAKAQQITARSYNVGAVLRDLAPATGWAVDAFGFVGRNSYDGNRKVMNNQEATGSERVTAAYSGSEVLVGVDAQYSNPINDTLNFIGSVNASLSNEKIGAYSESKYFSWDARTMTQATGGITAGLEYHKNAFTSFATLSLQRSSLQQGKTATYTNNGTAGSFTDNSTCDTRRSVNVGFDYAGNEGMTLSGAVEAFSSTGGVSGNSASLTANWKF